MYQPRRGRCSAAGVECLRKQVHGFLWARLLKRSRLSSCSSRPCANHRLIGPPGLANIFDNHKDLSSLAVRIAGLARQLVLDVWGALLCYVCTSFLLSLQPRGFSTFVNDRHNVNKCTTPFANSLQPSTHHSFDGPRLRRHRLHLARLSRQHALS